MVSNGAAFPAPQPGNGRAKKVTLMITNKLSHPLQFNFMRRIPILLALCFLVLSARAAAQTGKNYFTIENYYKVKWGFADEFVELWRTNHFPLLRKAMEKGDIISVDAERPVMHSGEDTRWDFKVTIVFKDAGTAFDPDLTTPYKKQLYPDLEKLKKDEEHRFELLLAHWDVMTEKIDLTKP